jgi:hypothetical protein
MPASPEVSGLFEVCVGVRSGTTDDECDTALDEAVHYWKQFGFREATDFARGSLAGPECEALYGIRGAAGLRSVRLFHGTVDHGLVRLMSVRRRPEGAREPEPSWKLTNLRTIGARWGAQLTEDLFNVHNHASDAAAAGHRVRCGEPQRCIIYKDAGAAEAPPFTGTIACVRELLVIQPSTVQNFYQR